MFLILKTTYFTGYADKNTPFVVRYNIKDVIIALEEVGENFIPANISCSPRRLQRNTFRLPRRIFVILLNKMS